jgi:hypothetical protein
MVTPRRGVVHHISRVMKSMKWLRMSLLSLVSEKGLTRILKKMTCERSSRFLELPYWKNLYVRHSIDVMHIEKNMCESFLGTLLITDEKARDHEHA